MGGLNSCDLAMNCTRRRRNAPTKKWSMNEKWFGAMMTGPGGTFSAAIHGSSKVRNWKRLQFPKVTVQYGEPMRWESVPEPTGDQQQQVANDIFAQIRGLYAGLDSLGRKGVARRLREARRAAGRTRATA